MRLAVTSSSGRHPRQIIAEHREETDMPQLIWGFMLLVAAGPAIAAPDDKVDEKLAPADQVKSLMADYEKSQKRAEPEALAARLLELAEENPEDEGVTPVALIHVVTLQMRGAEATKLRRLALERLARDHAASDQLGRVVLQLTYEPSSAGAAFLRAVADKNPKDELKGKATYGLGAMLSQAAKIARQLLQKPELEQRVEAAFGKETALWLRGVDADRLVEEAEGLFETAAEEFADVPIYGDLTLGDAAKGQLFEIRNLSIGKAAPEIEGEDLDGTAFKLSDYRGKVVVIDFWGNW
jgi:hypothetical protein